MSPKTSEEWADAFGFLFPEEVTALKTLAKMLPPRPTAINIGAGTGTSGLALLEAREDLHLFSIDIEGGISPTGGLGNERFAFEEAGIDPARYYQIESDSLKEAEAWSVGPVDFIFIDGDHGASYVEKEGPAWWAHVKPGGIMAFHDYDSTMWGDLTLVIDNMSEIMSLGEPILQVKTIIAFKKEEQYVEGR